MRPFKRLTIPTGVHPLVVELFKEMALQQVSVMDMAERSGVDRKTLMNWRHHSNPRLQDLDACFNVLGWGLTKKWIAK